MQKRTVSALFLSMLIMFVSILGLNVFPVEAQDDAVHIRADGSVDPQTAPIQRNGDLYTLSSDILSSTDGIVIERDNVILDGAAFAVQALGASTSDGIASCGKTNVTIKNLQISGFQYGIYIYGSYSTTTSRSNILCQNNITNCSEGGILFWWSSNNIVWGNSISSCNYGVLLSDSSDNTMIYDNQISRNSVGVFLSSSSNTVFANSIVANDLDIDFNGVSHNSVLENEISSSGWDVIDLWMSSYNRIAGNNITGGGSGGIKILDSQHNTIEDNVIANNGDGILITQDSKFNTIYNNTIARSTWDGIASWGSADNDFLENTITSNPTGIELISNSKSDRIVGNSISANCGTGIILQQSSNIDISGNTITSNINGISCDASSNVSITNNIIKDNTGGIWIGASTHSTIAYNTLRGQWSEGLSIWQSSDNTIVGNDITNNNRGTYWAGITVGYSSNNRFFFNIIRQNGRQVDIQGDSTNAWDNGYPSGGNYWSDYAGVDANGDGIGDTPYFIDANNIDRYPRMSPQFSIASFWPSVITAQVGTAFNVSIVAVHVENLWAWQVGLAWDPTIFEFVSYSWGDFQTSVGASIRNPPVVNDTEGKTTVPALESALRAGNGPLTSAETTLLTVTFTVLKPGISSLHLTDVSFRSQNTTETSAYPRWSDVDSNGQVDDMDVAAVLNCWKNVSSNQTLDFNNDGKVDITDVSIVTSDLGKNNSSPEWGVTNTIRDLHPTSADCRVEAQSSEFYLSVPYHHQINGYYCGPAALEEVFDFYGPDVSQLEIGSVERTTPAGTYTPDMIRAAHFSNISTTAGWGNFSGYATRDLGYAAFQAGGLSIDDLKSVIAAGYPVIVLTTWHFRVAVGYNLTHMTFQDPYYGKMFNMSNSEFNQDWDYSGHWAMFVSPWKISISNPKNVLPGDLFNVTATITYPWITPFWKEYPASTVNATVVLPRGLNLISGTEKQMLDWEFLAPGDSTTVTWLVQANSSGHFTISVEAEGAVNGFAPPEGGYPWYTYTDRIGGSSCSTVAVTSPLDTSPPTTTNDYDAVLHNANFTINLTVQDDLSGVMETHYRINDGPEKTVGVDGQPLFTTSSINNTLEYWSTDWAGNEESPHNFLFGIKLDKTKPILGSPMRTPSEEVQRFQEVKVAVNATDAVSGIKNVTVSYIVTNGTIWNSCPMSINASTGLFETTIPGQPAGALVEFRIVAYDQADNRFIDDNVGNYYTYKVPTLHATTEFDMQILNLGCKSGSIVAFVELSNGYNADDIDASSIRLNDTVASMLGASIGDHDSDSIPDLMICFNRTEVNKLVLSSGVTNGDVALALTGRVSDGSRFEGTYTIRVRMAGDANIDGKVDIKDIAIAARAFGSCQGDPKWNFMADENEDGKINVMDIALIARNFGKTY